MYGTFFLSIVCVIVIVIVLLSKKIKEFAWSVPITAAQIND